MLKTGLVTIEDMRLKLRKLKESFPGNLKYHSSKELKRQLVGIRIIRNGGKLLNAESMNLSLSGTTERG